MRNPVTTTTRNEADLYYRRDWNDTDHGPVAQQELEKLIGQGVIARDAEVRKDGTSIWIRVVDFLSIADAESSDEKSPSIAELTKLIDEVVIDSTDAEPSDRERSSVSEMARSIDEFVIELEGCETGAGKPEVRPSVPKVRRWICRVYGEEVGPVEFSLLRQMAEQRQISQTDRVRCEGEAKWVLADSVPELFDGLDQGLLGGKSRSSFGLSPELLSKVVPEPADERATKPANTSYSKAHSAKSFASPGVQAALPAASGSQVPGHSGSSVSAADPMPPPADPVLPPADPVLPPAGPTAPYSAFSGSADSPYRKPSYSPSQYARKGSSQSNWTFSLDELGGGKIGLVAGVIVAVIAGSWFAWDAYGPAPKGPPRPTVEQLQQAANDVDAFKASLMGNAPTQTPKKGKRRRVVDYR